MTIKQKNAFLRKCVAYYAYKKWVKGTGKDPFMYAAAEEALTLFPACLSSSKSIRVLESNIKSILTSKNSREFSESLIGFVFDYKNLNANDLIFMTNYLVKNNHLLTAEELTKMREEEA